MVLSSFNGQVLRCKSVATTFMDYVRNKARASLAVDSSSAVGLADEEKVCIDYSTGFWCNICGLGPKDGKGMERYFCAPCTYDLCKDCALAKHPLPPSAPVAFSANSNVQPLPPGTPSQTPSISYQTTSTPRPLLIIPHELPAPLPCWSLLRS